jgi:hypothetical protein
MASFLVELGFELRASYLQRGVALVHSALVLQATCLDWPQYAILPISASQIGRTADMTHQCPTHKVSKENFSKVSDRNSKEYKQFSRKTMEGKSHYQF